MNQNPACAGRDLEAFSPHSGGEVFLCPPGWSKKSSSFVLALLGRSTYDKKYASRPRLLRPCWTDFLNSLGSISRELKDA